MSYLYNRISNKLLKSNFVYDSEERITISFYKYCDISNPTLIRNNLYTGFNDLNILGRIYIANEGINAQISVPIKNYTIMKAYLFTLCNQFYHFNMNHALDRKQSFWSLRVKVRNKIVADGFNEDVLFDNKNVGVYLTASRVNMMLDDNDVTFIDMRNIYEYEVGHFENAVVIYKNTFRDQLKVIVDLFHNKKNKKIVMYCTGGIRCEKATFWMKINGFKKIYHIYGGILGYVHDAKKNKLPIRFKGKNFVFDARLGERVSKDIISYCHQCYEACDTHRNCNYNFCHKLFIQCISCNETFYGCCSVNCFDQLYGII
ncbi:rhodanese-related sulfurtransferase [Buchnera aphidicola (Formosaphis micheliae)]|uniref:oxygen-dependent tRNA uridine(34) hydroxylase TrhO n=1 Tax=Buchnera aphidicola TaxID=9 RepID=UPI0031B8377A